MKEFKRVEVQPKPMDVAGDQNTKTLEYLFGKGDPRTVLHNQLASFAYAICSSHVKKSHSSLIVRTPPLNINICDAN